MGTTAGVSPSGVPTPLTRCNLKSCFERWPFNVVGVLFGQQVQIVLSDETVAKYRKEDWDAGVMELSPVVVVLRDNFLWRTLFDDLLAR
jgi:hypothetical protein